MERGTEFQIGGETYVLGKFIGQGGMSQVYTAHRKNESETEGHCIAVKFLPPNMARDKRRIKALKEEFNIIRKIPDPENYNIIKIYDMLKIKDGYCLVMPYLRGGNLTEKVINKEKVTADKFPFTEKVRIARDIAYGLAYLHAYDIVHGDIKPSNILFNEENQVRITDFGLSHFSSNSFLNILSNMLIFGLLVKNDLRGGTPAYMSPEQFKGAKPDKSADIYALGALLFELFTGNLPYSPYAFSNNRKSLMKGHYIARKKDRQAMTIKSQLLHLPFSLQEIILGCLMFDKKDRFQTIGSVYVRLDQIK
ncbi:MAG: serine/threonine-protein kinase [Candidatus Ratteibacteria bacterium]|nr:serine/threonine-protein kinase [Candidatus Ratteibacteria bacterium]